MSAPKWVGVQVAMQSAIAAAKTVTAVTEADPGVASSTTHGYSNGDIILMTAQGMGEINDRLFRAASVAADTFALEGEDTTDYNTFSSGSAQEITLGTTFSTLKSISASGGEFDMMDTTTIHDLIKKQEPGMASAIAFSFDSYWDIADAALQACIAASKTQQQRAFQFTFADGKKMLFYGYVGATGLPTGSTGEKVVTKITITASGLPTYYSS
jgi:hypothetical protein